MDEEMKPQTHSYNRKCKEEGRGETWSANGKGRVHLSEQGKPIYLPVFRFLI